MGMGFGSDAAESNLHQGSGGQNLIRGQSEATEEEPTFLAMSIISERQISVTSAKNNVAISPGETPKNWLGEGLLEDVSKQTIVSNQVPPVSEWTMGYETSTSVVTYRPPRHEGPIYINGGAGYVGIHSSGFRDFLLT
ncbi:unnamed protein product [Rhodiola kirilowii]